MAVMPFPGTPRQKVLIDLAHRGHPLVYIKLTDEPVYLTKEYLPGVNVDLDDEGRLRGIELFGDVEISSTNNAPRTPETVLPYRRGMLGEWNLP